MMKEATFVIIGGGIAGVSCAEGIHFLAPNERVILITSSPTIKAVTNLTPLSKMLMQFDVEEKSAQILSNTCPSVSVIEDSVVSLDTDNYCIHTSSGEIVKFKKLCICSGASPKLIDIDNPFIIGIRDTDSVKEFQKRVSTSRRVMIVGNGGIATEIVHEISGMEIIWVIKDKHISATFIDPGAAQFFQSRLKKETVTNDEVPFKRMKYTISERQVSEGSGAALGPDWHTSIDLQGLLERDYKVTIEYSSEVEKILTPEEAKVLKGEGDWPVFVELTNGKLYGCDFIVSATGVAPNVGFLKENKNIELTNDGGIQVDWKMESSVPDIFAAGDVCTANWDLAKQWFQMRLWTQARQMGIYAAKAMVSKFKGEEFMQDFSFELFTHVTKFFGMKVVLLGLFNGQKLGNEYELLLRIRKNVEYIKLVLKDGRLQGAVLIGETDLEEMCENLILNQLDLSDYGEDLLNPDIDIEDYFD